MSFNSLFGLGSHSPDASLEGWWPLQETTSTQADDYSGNARHGTINGMGSNPVTTTGPNGWLASAFDFDGTDDYVSLPAAVLNGVETNQEFTVGCFGNVDTAVSDGTFFGRWLPSQLLLWHDVGGLGQGLAAAVEATGTVVAGVDNSDGLVSHWKYLAATYNGTLIKAYVDGAETDSVSVTGSIPSQTTKGPAIGSDNDSAISRALDGKVACVFVFSRALFPAELGEAEDGPEPVNTSAPLVTGLAPEGSTLSCSTGTWGLDSPFSGGSNGTITYSYQWTRNGSDISGATSSTYVTQAADVGNDIGCRVRASNSGGFDSAADTDSSNTVTVTSSGGGISIPVAMAHYRRMRAA